MTRPGRLSVVDQLKAKRYELLRQVSELDADLSDLTGEIDPSQAPVVARDFVRESGEFEWIVGSLIAEGSVTMVAAEPRLGKTTLLVQLALCLSAGVGFLDFHVPRAARTLYVLAEGSRHAFRARFRTACASLQLDPDGVDWWIQPAGEMDFLLRGNDVERLVGASGAKLVILDTLGYFHGGDENDASEWKRYVMAPLRSMAVRHGCAFVLVHHYGKSVPGRSRWERGRGSSAMFGDVDHWLGLERVELSRDEEQLGDARKLELAQRRELFIEKNKYGRDDFSVRMDFDKSRGIFALEL